MVHLVQQVKPCADPWFKTWNDDRVAGIFKNTVNELREQIKTNGGKQVGRQEVLSSLVSAFNEGNIRQVTTIAGVSVEFQYGPGYTRNSDSESPSKTAVVWPPPTMSSSASTTTETRFHRPHGPRRIHRSRRPRGPAERPTRAR